MALLIFICIALAFILAIISAANTPYSHNLLVGAVLFLALAVVLLAVLKGVVA